MNPDECGIKMSGELPAYRQDIRWLCGGFQRRGLGKPAKGPCSAFAERVAIKLEGETDADLVRDARQEAISALVSLWRARS